MARPRSPHAIHNATWLLLLSLVAQVACRPRQNASQRTLETVAQAAVLLGQGISLGSANEGALRGVIVVIHLGVLVGLAGVLTSQVRTKSRPETVNPMLGP